MNYTFTIDGRLPGLNDIIGAARYNRFAGATQKKTEQHKVAFYIMAGNIPTFNTPVTVHFKWIEKNLRRDPDNVCAGAKFVMDALVELKRIPDDTRQWIKEITHEFPPADKKHPRIEVTIKPSSP